MIWPVISLASALDSSPIFVDGDWVESKDQDPEGDVRLIQLADVGDGYYVNKSSRFLTSESAQRLNCTFLEPGDVLVARMPDPLGRACIFPGDTKRTVTVVDVCIIRPDTEKVHAPWLMHCINSPQSRNQISGYITGTTRARISRGNLAKVGVRLPPLEEQRHIAAILDQAETLRTQRRAALALLDSLTQSLFLDMFGDPSAEDSKWSQTQLDVVAELVTGYPFRSEEYVGPDEGIKLCRGANVLPGRLDWRDMVCWPHEKVKEAEAFHLRAGDIVMAMDRPWISEGFKLTKVDASDCPMLLVQRVARIRPKSEVTNEYLLAVLSHGAFTRHCKPTETTIPHISPKDIRSFSFPLPPLPLQQTFATRIASIEALKATHRRALAALDALFASLQQRAFAGAL